jgi:hypothetical protein
LDHLKLLLGSTADAVKLDIHLTTFRGKQANAVEALVPVSVQGTEKCQLPLTKEAIEAIPDIDLQCVISSFKHNADHSFSSADEADISAAVIKFILQQDYEAK